MNQKTKPKTEQNKNPLVAETANFSHRYSGLRNNEWCHCIMCPHVHLNPTLTVHPTTELKYLGDQTNAKDKEFWKYYLSKERVAARWDGRTAKVAHYHTHDLSLISGDPKGEGEKWFPQAVLGFLHVHCGTCLPYTHLSHTHHKNKETNGNHIF